MLPYKADETWLNILTFVLTEAQLRGERLQLPDEIRPEVLMRRALMEHYQSTENQANVAAKTLIEGVRDPSPDRKRLVGRWVDVEEKGVIGFGESSRTAREYTFQSDFTYRSYFSSASSYTSPPGPVVVMRTPTFFENKESGVYFVVAREKDTVVCLCSDKGDATALVFSIDSGDRVLWLENIGQLKRA
jgi:hypothetical protein